MRLAQTYGALRRDQFPPCPAPRSVDSQSPSVETLGGTASPLASWIVLVLVLSGWRNVLVEVEEVVGVVVAFDGGEPLVVSFVVVFDPRTVVVVHEVDIAPWLGMGGGGRVVV